MADTSGGQPADGGRFDAAGLFDDDYLYFYAGLLDDARSDADADAVWQLLGLGGGTPVLDLACGHGRIANRLAARGARVTGLDATPLFLDRARADATRLGLDVEYVLGDMRALPWTGRFAAAVNWFTAFGYFPDEENRHVLAEVLRALRPGGRFLLELQHRDNLMTRLLPVTLMRRGDDLVVDQHHFDVPSGRMVATRTLVRGGRSREVEFFVRLFGFTEIRDWLLQAGFAAVDGYGPDGTLLTLDSRRLLVVATAP